MPVRFRILGPVEIEADGRIISLPRRRERCLLGVLLLEANRPVSVDRLADLLWEDDPPKHIRGAVQGHMSRLRAALVAAGAGSDVELVFAGEGYRLAVDPETVDAYQFRTMREGAAGIVDTAERVAQLRAALDLWRGPALADALSDSGRDRWCSDLEEQRLDAFEDMVSASLLLRREREILPDLARAAGGNPGRESLVGLHMRALYHAGRRADALDVYARARAFLSDELGLDPGPELRELHQAILRDELAPLTPSPMDQRRKGATQSLIPRQLPADVANFTGRQAQLDQLDSLLPKPGEEATSVVISAIGGAAGIGKTALAVHVGHRMSHRYQDGQIFIDLHGFSEGMVPVDPLDALDRMLRALDVPGERIPSGLEDRAGLWRSVLAGRRMLIVLDNASTETQVAPLLPGVAGCLVLVTSRRRLAGLDATHTISLDVLPPTDALTLFTRIVGPDHCAEQPIELAAEIVEICGRLPLAIRIAAARLRSHPSWSMAEFVERLRHQDHQLSELVDGTRGVAAALELSIRQLTSEEQRMFRLLGMHPGQVIDPYAAAALADVTLAKAGRVLDQLHDAHLLLEPAAGRFAFHDLVRAHASYTAAVAETEPVRRAALGRLLDYYRHTAAVAMNAAYQYECERRPRVASAVTPVPRLSEPAAGTDWLDIELPNLLAAAQRGADDGWPTYIVDISRTLHRHLSTRGHYREAQALHRKALTVARATGDHAAELEAMIGLGNVHRMLGHFERAADDFQQALRLAQSVGHRVGKLDALRGLGHINRQQGRYQEATEHYQQALLLARTTGYLVVEIDALTGLGDIDRLQGRYQEATEHYQQVLPLARASGYMLAELGALTGLGHIRLRLGQYTQATNDFQQALPLARTCGYHSGELTVLTGLGQLHRLRGWYRQATEHYQQALPLARTTGHRVAELTVLTGLGWIHLAQDRRKRAADQFQHLLVLARETGARNYEFEALQGLGRLELAAGDAAAAAAHHQHALALATDLGQLADQARAHDGLAYAYEASERPERARRHWQAALGILASLDTNHTEEEQVNTFTIRAKLTAVAETDTLT